MELMAVIQGLRALKRPCQVCICTDSRYVQDGITLWIKGWQQNGWRTKARTPVKNEDLWRELLEALAPHTVTWTWVKGHSGHPENDRVDTLARQALQNKQA
jgi:ribonuclease HI